MEEEEEDRHEVDVAARAGVAGESGRPVPEGPVDGRAEDGDGDLGYDVGGAEGDPAVDAGGEFSGFPESTVLVEFGDDGVDDGRGDEEDQEGCEHPVLHIGDAVS